MDAVVGQDGVHAIRHGDYEVAQEVAGDAGGRRLVRLDEGELEGSVDPDD